MSMDRFHVIPMGKGWALRREGSTQTLTRYRTPGEAENAARRRYGDCEVIVDDGACEVSDSKSRAAALEALAAAFRVPKTG